MRAFGAQERSPAGNGAEKVEALFFLAGELTETFTSLDRLLGRTGLCNIA